MQQANDRWTDILAVIISAIAVAVSVGGTVASILWQKRLEARRQKLDLFDRRYILFERLMKFETENALYSSYNNGADHEREIVFISERLQYLFPERAISSYGAFYRAFKDALDMKANLAGNNVNAGADPNYKEAVRRAVVAERSFRQMLDLYLMLVDNRPPWWQRICNWVDRSQAESNDDARKRMGLNP